MLLLVWKGTENNRTGMIQYETIPEQGAQPVATGTALSLVAFPCCGAHLVWECGCEGGKEERSCVSGCVGGRSRQRCR